MSHVGVLALQGDFPRHIERLRALGCAVSEVRTPGHLKNLDALVWPGGESTTMTRVMSEDMRSALLEFCSSHPVWGTCAGMIMLAKTYPDPRVKTLELADVLVNRNGWGRQVHSFEAELSLTDSLKTEPPSQGTPFHGVFIRAPRVERVGEKVSVLAWYNEEPVALAQGKILLTTFHPELTRDDRFHRLFLSWIKQPI